MFIRYTQEEPRDLHSEPDFFLSWVTCSHGHYLCSLTFIPHYFKSDKLSG